MTKKLIRIVLLVVAFAFAFNIYFGQKPLSVSAGEPVPVEAEADLKLFALTWQEEIVSRLQKMIQDYKNVLDLSDLQISVDYWDEVRQVMQDEMQGSPDYFIINPDNYTYFTINRVFDRIEFKYLDEYTNADGTVKQSAIKDDRKKLNRSIEDIMAGIQPEMSALEKALWVHDWMVREIDYAVVELSQKSPSSRIYGIVGALVDRKAVCDGYTEAYLIIMRKLGIPAKCIASDSMNHSWNMIQIDGSWYHVDVTWDDPLAADTDYGQGNHLLEGRVTHEYFLKSDKEFRDLKHYSWTATAPDADKDNSYPGYIFRTNSITCFYNHGGYWYFNEENKLIKSKLDGTKKSEQRMSEPAVSMHGLGDSLFYAASNQVYILKYDDMAEGLKTKAYQTENNHSIKEFTIQDGYLVIHTKGPSGYGKKTINARNLVDQPTIEWTKMTTTMKVGEKKTFAFTSNNYDVENILWKTSKKKIVTVGKNQGKTKARVTAQSVGTDTLYLQYGKDKLLILMIVVTE